MLCAMRYFVFENSDNANYAMASALKPSPPDPQRVTSWADQNARFDLKHVCLQRAVLYELLKYPSHPRTKGPHELSIGFPGTAIHITPFHHPRI